MSDNKNQNAPVYLGEGVDKSRHENLQVIYNYQERNISTQLCIYDTLTELNLEK